MDNKPSIREIGRLARKIDLRAFSLSMERNSPEQAEAIRRRMKALTDAERQLQHDLREG